MQLIRETRRASVANVRSIEKQSRNIPTTGTILDENGTTLDENVANSETMQSSGREASDPQSGVESARRHKSITKKLVI
eukprot:SAG31_NODE_13183_length_887_cov_1.142132_1_plen_78_part_10